MTKRTVPVYNGTLRNHSIRLPHCIRECSAAAAFLECASNPLHLQQTWRSLRPSMPMQYRRLAFESCREYTGSFSVIARAGLFRARVLHHSD